MAAMFEAGTKHWARPQNTVKQIPSHPRCQQNRDGGNAIHHRSDLGSLAQQVSRRIERAKGWAMIETSAILGLISLALFAAHAVDAYRTR